MNSFFKRAYEYGYVQSVVTVEELLEYYDSHLFQKLSSDNYCLHHLLPIAKSAAIRDGHSLLIERVKTELHKGVFINGMVFSDCY